MCQPKICLHCGGPPFSQILQSAVHLYLRIPCVCWSSNPCPASCSPRNCNHFGSSHFGSRLHFGSSVSAQVFPLARVDSLWVPGVMPIAKEHMEALKDGNTQIQFAQENPKKPGSKAWDRYEAYKGTTTIAQATENKAGWQDLTADFEKGFLKIMSEMGVDTTQGATKRPAPEGTPDRETQARTKAQASEVMPRILPTEVQDPISKVEMSAATIATLRAVMREEITIGMSALEGRLTNKMDEQFIQMKQDLEQERSARTMLEERVAQLESKQANKENTNDVTEAVDKSIAVIGGFVDTTVEEAEELVHDLLEHVHGFHEVSMVDGNSIVGLAQFDTPAHAMKFIRSQKKHPQIQTNKLWVAENRSRMERNQAKIASKLKKFLIELANIPPKDVIVNYKLFNVIVRDNGKLMPIAFVKDDLSIDWNEASDVPVGK